MLFWFQSPSSSRSALSRLHIALLLLIIILAVSVRILLIQTRPILLTNDSHDYLLASIEIVKDWTCKTGCYDWRLPGYPLFLAGIFGIAGHSIKAVLLVQLCLGILGLIAGFFLARQTNSTFAGLGLALYLALYPALIFFEHLLLTETLFLLLTIGMIFAGWLYFLKPHSLSNAVKFGLIGATATLVRGNALILQLAMALLISIRLVAITRNRHNSLEPFQPKPGWTIWRPFIFSLGVFMLVISPWLYRNYVVYGEFTLTLNNNRNRLVYFDHHNIIDANQPYFSRCCADTYLSNDVYAILSLVDKLNSQTVPGESAAISKERAAKALIFEQIAAHPKAYAREIIYSFLYMSGFNVPNLTGERNFVPWMMRDVFNNRESWQKINAPHKRIFHTKKINYQFYWQENVMTGIWQIIWDNLFSYAKITFSILSLCTLLAITAMLVFSTAATTIILDNASLLATLRFFFFLLLSYLGTLLAHSVNLADFTRFMLPFEWIPALITLLGLTLIYHTCLNIIRK